MSKHQAFSMPTPDWFKQPESMREHNAEVFGGCYDIPTMTFAKPPVVLDIGACCGAFSFWASERWRNATITAYEANEHTRFGYLNANVYGRGGIRVDVGVAPVAGSYPLYLGKHNIGEASRWKGGEQSDESVLVDFVGAATLPECDVLKVDTEGGESELIATYLLTHDPPAAIMCEFHGAGRMPIIDGYFLARAAIWQADRGVVCFLRQDVWEKAKEAT